ncbi:cytochrome c biogenesis protein CcsA [Paraconexibacter sp.]|uniref:cytochrome c biogenesis protein CcsA n=1 Tax=Paraconexibacter sp. TaxID=2949640 RepID=UPI003563890C
MYGTRLRPLSTATVFALLGAFALAAWYAPMDADQGFTQKIIYVHVPLAIVTLCGFVFGGIMAIKHLRTRDPRYDLRSYTAIHVAQIFGVGALITGMIWARASWGVWWEWREATLVSFLIVFLLFATYQPLRFSIEDPERQARYASVFAVTAGAFVPVNFLAVRLADAYIHPRVLTTSGSGLTAEMSVAFFACVAAMALFYVTMWRFELAHKHTRFQLRALRRKLGGDEIAYGRSAAPQMLDSDLPAPS